VVIEFELPDPGLEELELVADDAIRGLAPSTAPLGGRVLVGGPHGFRLTPARVAADPAIAEFVEENAAQAYYFVYLAVSFTTLEAPTLASARVLLDLSAVPATPPPFALSMKPLADGDPVAVKRTVSFGPKLKLLDAVDTEIGHADQETSWQRTDFAVRGLGLASAQPGWEFTRTASRKLAGSSLLKMVVQAEDGASVTVSGTVTARTGGNIVRRWARRLPVPLQFAAVIS
jgi:hypothetical protein